MSDSPSIPTAVVRSRRTGRWLWLLPLGALALAAWLGWRAWALRGIPITVQLDDGYGLKTSDDVRYRGISVGEIDSIAIQPDMQGVLVHARIKRDSQELARSGSKFWVVRPQLQLMHVEGLETLIGPRYLAVQPATGVDRATLQPQREFIGLTQPPVVDATQPGDLEIVLQAKQRGSLQAGAPVTYRQTRIGTILSVGLNTDGSAVEARAHIQQPFVQLIRPNTKFWDAGGFQARFGITGVSIEVDSAEALLTGGVALATPPPADSGGEVVRTGHRFTLADKPDEDWLDWQPAVAIGNSLLPPGVSPPSPLRATIGWKQGRWIKGTRSNQGWVLQTTDGLLGPSDLLKPSDKADRDSVVLEIAGTVVPLNDPPAWEKNGLAMLKSNVVRNEWPPSQARNASEPEDCLVIADPSDAPLPLAASRLTAKDDQWQIDAAVPITASQHGGSVISRRDGKLLGILLANGGRPVIALLPAQAFAKR